jgi:hypothetical protein
MTLDFDLPTAAQGPAFHAAPGAGPLDALAGFAPANPMLWLPAAAALGLLALYLVVERRGA